MPDLSTVPQPDLLAARQQLVLADTVTLLVAGTPVVVDYDDVMCALMARLETAAG